MSNLDTAINIANFENSVNKIFECQQKEIDLHLNQPRPNAEEILLRHLAQALQLIDRSAN